MDVAHEHAADDDVHAVGDLDRFVADVFGAEADFSVGDFDLLERAFAVDDGDDDVVVLRGEAVVDHEQIAVEDAGDGHAIALGPVEEGGGRMGDDVLVEVDAFFDVVVGGGGEACGDAQSEERAEEFFIGGRYFFYLEFHRSLIAIRSGATCQDKYNSGKIVVGRDLYPPG